MNVSIFRVAGYGSRRYDEMFLIIFISYFIVINSLIRLVNPHVGSAPLQIVVVILSFRQSKLTVFYRLTVISDISRAMIIAVTDLVQSN
jgi:antibiotic biosynthesis monooxygenase (ABM) superfamily enzyme